MRNASAPAKVSVLKEDKKEKKILTGSHPEKYFSLTNHVLGKGAYGTVIKAIQKKTSRVVAMKIMDIQKDDHKGLKDELSILATCNGPYTVEYIANFVKSGKFYIAMEYCAAGSVMDLMQICRITLTESEIAVCMKHSLKGLAQLHKSKIIHRDIKAANLLLTETGDCKLADFGVSKRLTNTLARTKTMIGTPYWMAPEVVDSRARKAGGYNAKADVWSLGITAIELGEGRPPLHNVYPMKALFLIPKNDPPTLDEEDDWSDNFKDFVKQCLQKDFKKRPSAEDLLKHKFITNAPDKKILGELVKKCIPQIETVRKIKAEEMEDDDDDEDDDASKYGETMQTTMTESFRSMRTSNSGTMIQSKTDSIAEPEYMEAMENADFE
mmetsp:Transcript_18595/g.27838  ORF Transcript_18595/g.27838 Transcript_18595/m.27838 type:complete len:382 (-) Transcript_18595:169-1314(-)